MEAFGVICCEQTPDLANHTHERTQVRLAPHCILLLHVLSELSSVLQDRAEVLLLRRGVHGDEYDVSLRDASLNISGEFDVPGYVHRLVEILFQIGFEEGQITSVPVINKLLIDIADFEVDLWIAVGHGDSSKGPNVSSSDTSHHQFIVVQLLEQHL